MKKCPKEQIFSPVLLVNFALFRSPVLLSEKALLWARKALLWARKALPFTC
jgi:hypothetical protein